MVVLVQSEYDKNPLYLKPGETPDAYKARTQPAAVAAPTTSPKIADIYGAVSPTDTNLNSLTSQYQTQASAPVDQAAIRKSIMDTLQREIDATNSVYASKVAEARVAGQNRTGQTTAINARRGLSGSDFGAAIQDKTTAANNDVIGAIENERGNALAALYSKGEARVSEEVQNQNEARKQGADRYLSYLKETEARRETRTTTAAQHALAAGVDLATASPQDIKQLAASYQIDPNKLIATFQSAKEAKAIADAELADRAAQTEARKIANQPNPKDNFSVIPDGSILYNTKEGKVVAENAKNFAPKAVPGGAGGGVGTTGTFKNDLDALVSNTYNLIPSLNGKKAFESSMKGARNEADKINTIASVVLKNSPAEIRRDFVNQTTAIRQIDRAISLLDQGVKTGVLQNKTQYAYNIVGKDFDPGLAAIDAHINSAIQPYRNSITGAAWGEQEDAEYNSLFGSTKYSPDELKARLVRIKEIMADKSTSALNAQVNPMSSYDPFTFPQQQTRSAGIPSASTGPKTYNSPSGNTYQLPY